MSARILKLGLKNTSLGKVKSLQPQCTAVSSNTHTWVFCCCCSFESFVFILTTFSLLPASGPASYCLFALFESTNIEIFFQNFHNKGLKEQE